MSSLKLRDALLDSLRALPGKRDFYIHVLLSSPRKHHTLYQHAHPRPRVYIQDVLVLLAEQLSSSPSSSSTPTPARVFVSAIEACIYNIPSTSSAILYISKVDSTGQGSPGVPPPTRTLVRSFISFYCNGANRGRYVPGAKRIWVQLFARAQSQYLFPNSADNGRKKWLSDVRLCSWWKNVLGEVAESVTSNSKEEAIVDVRLCYLLPGFNELEALQTMGQGALKSASTSRELQWMYGHPYSLSNVPLPCPRPPAAADGTDAHNLGHYIPTFDDDPKSRFMDEIAYTSNLDGVKSPPRKRAKTIRDGPASHPGEQEDAEKDGKDKEKRRPAGDLAKVTADEFWERMSFRQECVQGAVTGFFTLVASESSSLFSPSESLPSPLAPQPGQVSFQIIKRIVSSLMTAHEFSSEERTLKATSVLEKAIKGLCEGVSLPLAAPVSGRDETSRPKTPEPHSSRPLISCTMLLSVPKTPPKSAVDLPDISPNPFPEPEPSLEKYDAFIYGVVKVDNPVPETASTPTEGTQPKIEPVVTVLKARKKVRKP